MTLEETIARIRPVDRSQEASIQSHIDNLTKPQGSLGQLENIAKRYVLASGQGWPSVGKKRVCVFAGDHGMVEAGFTFSEQVVTGQIVRNMLAGGAGINVFSRHVGVEVECIDVGIAADMSDAEGLLDRKVAWGTQNIGKGPAMTMAECEAAVGVGIERAQVAAAEGVTMVATGEMGIGNTTPSSALLAALLPCSVPEATGPGAGFKNADGLRAKIALIEQALEVNRAALDHPLTALAAVGGLEIAALTGLCLGAAEHKMPIVVDGIISSAAALVACRLCPEVADYMFLAHQSADPGHAYFVKGLGLQPILQLDLRLGEGTGSVLAMHLIDAAIKMYTEMASFTAAKVTNPEVNARCYPA
ncbi:nicotinate-nucleotide--dimethylbenzimidazole phosphoribosyltransferase [Coraliomargarita algicola]|uniref:Nicotinate-nucleotide--dimethylbenzimidazole phosphoribosyltransferase n=1 Tax=Coraliomargarita algicola TaxID=3092156 RepID=A0ABZ0RHD8_9BACT|nr:nicotinate-nucleotide--dimethylbenzimidazole phosphoribosyltransferase [Coraliomargarita sp. J2-16]WPJ94611.1 nicotinate-nucleotide--dimethylbenzimidazole phosphoribosyltransferase [Coraliomargarita sp. J2-16]